MTTNPTSTTPHPPYPIRRLQHPWIRYIEPLVDLGPNDPQTCERSSCDEKAEYVAGGEKQGGGFGCCGEQTGWLLCPGHTQSFSWKTGAKMPRRCG